MHKTSHFVSMGDWRLKRDGLTAMERGIPVKILDKTIKDAGMEVIQKHYFACMTSFFRRNFNPHCAKSVYFKKNSMFNNIKLD
ncbi:hypothetical protein FACS1894199_04020 [Bacteroidia bacterium]|nr:hypothetical protein FACS1894199_04020 [Bacteroidia bacterium]